jgi:hypothetical protein
MLKTPDEFIDFYFGKDLHDFDRLTIRAMMTSFGKNCFETSREFDSIDGVVDIHIVSSFSDCRDLTPVYATFNEYINGTNKNNTN